MKNFTLEKKLIAQVRYFEEMFKIRDKKGETIFVGSEAMAKKFVKILNAEAPRKPRRKVKKK